MLRNNETVIHVHNLKKAFGSHTIFDGFSCDISVGKMVAIVGPSGCGKSTLLHILGALEPFDSGAIEILGSNIPKVGSYKAELLARNTINFLLQGYGLIENMTVKDNLLMALKYVKKNKAEKCELIGHALEQVGLKVNMDDKIAQFSGGEQQRIALARCMIKPARIILADEPTGSLDPRNRDIVVHLLKQISQTGMCIVLVTHDMCVAESCDTIIQLSHS